MSSAATKCVCFSYKHDCEYDLFVFPTCKSYCIMKFSVSCVDFLVHSDHNEGVALLSSVCKVVYKCDEAMRLSLFLDY